MYLSDHDIMLAVKDGSITIHDFDPKRLGPVSYDVILDNDFIVTDVHKTLVIDPVKKIFPQTKEHHVKEGEAFYLFPGETVLGKVRDFVGSDKYLIQISGKSSLARVGLVVHNTAGLINPGHFLNLTLELSNINRVPLVLRPGMQIAQFVFSQLTSPVDSNYKKVGRFSKNNWAHFKPAKQERAKKKK
jgi:dCTP deaminase